MAEKRRDPVREWHALCHEATGHQSAGAFDRSLQVSSAALEHGVRHGIHAAPPVFAAQRFFELWVTGRAAELAPLISANSADARELLAFAAARAVVAVDAGDPGGAGLVEALVDQVASRPTAPSATTAACLLADVVGADPEAPTGLADALTGVLEPLSGTLDLLGAGVVSLGPVDRYLALLRRCRGGDVGPLLAGARRLVGGCRGLELWDLVVARDQLLWGPPADRARAATRLAEMTAATTVDADVVAAIAGDHVLVAG
jgi:hypothetical protein